MLTFPFFELICFEWHVQINLFFFSLSLSISLSLSLSFLLRHFLLIFFFLDLFRCLLLMHNNSKNGHILKKTKSIPTYNTYISTYIHICSILTKENVGDIHTYRHIYILCLLLLFNLNVTYFSYTNVVC